MKYLFEFVVNRIGSQDHTTNAIISLIGTIIALGLYLASQGSKFHHVAYVVICLVVFALTMPFICISLWQSFQIENNTCKVDYPINLN